MYIESADLCERHADIKYQDIDGNLFENGLDTDDSTSGNYILKDCNSKSGTWVRLKPAFGEYHYPLLVNLHD